MKRLLLLFLLLLTSLSFAQLASGSDPEQVADEAVRDWLEQDPITLLSLSTLPLEQQCQMLPDLLLSPPPGEGTTVNFSNRREVASKDDSLRIYSYPASLPNGRLEVVEVTLELEGDTWTGQNVGYRLDSLQGGARSFVQSAAGGWLFVVLSVGLLYLLFRPSSFFRRWLSEGWRIIKLHRGLVIGTLISFYSIFALGIVTGVNLPQVCAEAIASVLQTSLETLGATEAYGSGNVARAASLTFYQNFVFATVYTTYLPALFFGFPAYLFNFFRFFAIGVPFGFVGGIDAVSLLLGLVLLVLELTAYFLVTAGGGMFLMTLIRQGFSGYREGIRKLTLMLPIAIVLLAVGAWYEALIIVVPQLLAGG